MVPEQAALAYVKTCTNEEGAATSKDDGETLKLKLFAVEPAKAFGWSRDFSSIFIMTLLAGRVSALKQTAAKEMTRTKLRNILKIFGLFN